MYAQTHATTRTLESNSMQSEATAKRNPYRLDIGTMDATYSEADGPSGIKLYPETKERAWS